MKSLIVIVNVVLAAAVIAALISVLRPAETSVAPSPKNTVKKYQNTRKNSAAPAEKNELPSMTPEQRIAAILAADLFNSERTPNAASGGRGNRVELTLVGTFKAGTVEGAVILQKSNTRQGNPFMQMMWGGGMPPSIAGMRQSGGNNGNAGVRRFAMRQNNQNSQRQTATAIKQYVRLGETLSNGYTLTALSRTRATLTRGGDKMELELQDPSKNQNSSRGTGQIRFNANQQLQQAQLATQQMMVRMLMDMRGGGGPGQGNPGQGNRSGNQGARGARGR